MPEPLSISVDFFILGEGEDVLGEVMDAYKVWKASGESRERYLEIVMLQIPGIYIPSFYDVEYNDDNTIKSFAPNRPNVPAKGSQAHYQRP